MSRILRNRAGNLRLELRDDRLSAWLTISGEKRLTDEQDILDLIEEAGIRTGFEEAARYMRKHGLEKDFDVAFPIAMSRRVKGESKLNYFFDLNEAKDFSGKVDASELEKLTCIEAGTVVADYGSNIFERQGSIYDIYGEMLQDEDFDLGSAKQVAGENVVFQPEKRQFIAESRGFISVDESGRISVLERLVLEQLPREAGAEIKCPADLEILSSVRGLKLRVAGDLIVRGDFAESALQCLGSLRLEGDIVDCREPGLNVAGKLECRGIRSSRVLCSGGLSFAELISDSEVVAGGGIFSEKGSIHGGHSECGGSLDVFNLGKPQGGETLVELSIGPYHKALLMQMTKELVRLREAGDSGQELSARIKAREEDLDAELNRFLNRPQGEKYFLKARGTAYPPLEARVLKYEYSIREPKQGLEIWEKD